MAIGECLEHGVEASQIMPAAEVGEGRRKGQLRAGPAEQAEGSETAERCAQMFAPDPTHKTVQLPMRVVWNVVRR